MRKLWLFGTAAALLGTPALAQEKAAAAPAVEEGAAVAEVVVTASRITLSGYSQPTPVTVVGAEQMQRDNQMDLSSVMVQLPAVGPSSSPNTANGSQSVSAGTAGLAFVNLRSLGTSRTLVLYDGIRVAASTQGGGVDLNLLPASLVDRIDVVTGGASAAWGSDAVSGVVNVILNKKFTGLQANLEAGTNERNTRRTGKVELSYGRDFDDGRGHLILSGSYLDSPDIVLPSETPWYKAQNLVNNPAWTATNGQPKLIHAINVGLSSATSGGLITSGPLKGTMFLENGAVGTFNFGNVTGVLSNGGTFENPMTSGQADDLAIPIRSTTLFGHMSYEFAPHVRSSFELNYGDSHTTNGSASYTRQGNLTIKNDNPYIPASVLAAMQAANITSFPLGTTNINNLSAANGDEFIEPTGLGNLYDTVYRKLVREVLDFNGEIRDWKWDASFQHSKIDRHTHVVVDPVINNYNLATDAVRVTSANVGSSGLAIGSIACRSTLTDPTNGCVPLNVLGIGVASPAAIAYVNSGPAASDLGLEQYSYSVSAQGTPFSLWAGPIAVAFGGEYRADAMRQTADQLSYARGYAAGNFQYMKGRIYDWEGFVEFDVPLLRDTLVKSLDFNAAGRYTDYSSSGPVKTWKIGVTSQIIDDIKLRGTISADIRAPSLQDLYNAGSSSIQVVADPFRNNQSTNIYAVVGGNPNLQPEMAKTYSAGVVLRPRFLEGFTASADWYSIDIKGAIVAPSFSFALAQCFAGAQVYCSLISRDANGVITQIASAPINIASYKTSGVDFQADYRRGIGPGQLAVSLIGNYTHNLTINSLGTISEQAGSLNMAPPSTSQGAPKLHGTLAATYKLERVSGTVQVRAFGPAKLNAAWTSLDVDDNHVPSRAFIDLRASYYVGPNKSVQFYGAIDNILDTNPPITPQGPNSALPYFYVPARTDIYDFLGRQFRVGVRARF